MNKTVRYVLLAIIIIIELIIVGKLVSILLLIDVTQNVLNESINTINELGRF